MDREIMINALKNLCIVIWEIIKWQPGIVVPFLLALIIGKIAHLSKGKQNLLEDFFGFFNFP
ncbi:MAG: hypothetical protein NC311_08620 [Muribaculaceae bacterium]|nr:hypothetical protein [Muribaculaceae bacterium]MCM1399885.1 hypothetical protein [Clostridium sp.]MCM1460629.1 hypothetical protein [Bacteroides sp.]